jgi:NADH-quinone oxidoreductase subunit N
MAHVGFGLSGPVFGGVLVLDRLATIARFGILGLTLLTFGMARGDQIRRNPAEFVAIILFATTGFTLMAAAQQLLLAFLALELASLSLYVLAGFDRIEPRVGRGRAKYFIFGAMSAAFLLFGFSLIYGATGSIDFLVIARQLAVQQLTPSVVIGFVMVLVAFGFKAAAAPFHLWAPDAYQGAPASSTALIASASKLAGLVLFTRLLWHGLGPVAGDISSAQGLPGWLPVVALISAASMLIGNFGALARSNVRRLLAYSAIAHAGALLLGVMAAGTSGVGALVYYALTYGIATIGAFGVIGAVSRASQCQNLADLAGLHRRSPLLAGCLAVFILSLAGIPPLAGFFGKFAVFAAALNLGGLAGPAGWLTMLAIALSAIALYYYLLVLKQALVASAAAPAISIPFVTQFTLVVCAAAPRLGSLALAAAGPIVSSGPGLARAGG